MSTHVPPGADPPPHPRSDDPDPEGLRPMEDAPDAGSDNGQPWAEMWRDALDAAFRTLPTDDEGPVPGDV